MRNKVTALGYAYNVNTGVQRLEPESSLVVQILNPEGSDRTVSLSYLAVSGKQKEISLEIIEDCLVLAHCQSLYPRGSFNFLSESRIKARYALQPGYPIVGGIRLKSILRKSGVLQIDFYEKVQIQPGHSLAFCLRNPVAGENRYTFNMGWIES